MPLRRSALLLGAVLLTLLAGPAVRGSASAATLAAGGETSDLATTLIAYPAMKYVAPGRTTTVHVGYYDGMYSFEEVSGARFSSSNRKVLRVSRTGTVTGVAPGDASVRVRYAGERIVVPIGVRTRMIWSTAGRVSASWHGSESVLHGVGFKPDSQVQLSTNGLPGVHVTPTATVDEQGTFSGTVGWDGYIVSGPTLSITYWGGILPEEYSCPPSATWIVTATDELAASASMSGTCPPG
jgi:hypothetical protein